MPATAAAYGVGILNVEPTPHQIVDKIDPGAGQVRQAVGIDDNLDAVCLKYLVKFAGIGFEGHPVLHPGATTPGDKNAQPDIGIIPILEQAFELFCRYGC
jgi:hypothetical protein